MNDDEPTPYRPRNPLTGFASDVADLLSAVEWDMTDGLVHAAAKVEQRIYGILRSYLIEDEVAKAVTKELVDGLQSCILVSSSKRRKP